MSGGPATGVVVDTMVISWLLNDRPEDLAGRYRDLIGANPVLLAFQTLMELRYGALRAGWGELRRRALARSLRPPAVTCWGPRAAGCSDADPLVDRARRGQVR
jgi:predicted nucleic acid-binding protein